MTAQPFKAAWGIIAGGALLALGAFLPWITVIAPLVGQLTRSGVDGGGDGWVVLGLGIVAVVLGVNSLNGSKSAARAAIVVGVLSGGLLVFEFVDVHDRISKINGDYTHGDYGMGLILCAIGAAAVFVSAIIAADQFDAAERKARMTATAP